MAHHGTLQEAGSIKEWLDDIASFKAKQSKGSADTIVLLCSDSYVPSTGKIFS